MQSTRQPATAGGNEQRPGCAAPGGRGIVAGRKPSGRGSRRYGIALLYMSILLTIIVGFVSLAVDVGRVQMIKTQLLRAADAAARYGATGLSDGTYIAKAINAAGANKADETSVVVQSSDIVPGNYNPLLAPTFSSARTPLNAVQVTAGRTTSRSNAVDLKFGGVIGVPTCNATAVAIAYYGPPLKALLVVGSLPLLTRDQMVSDRLAYQGFAVTAKDENTAGVADTIGMGIVVISETILSTKVHGRFRDVTVPVLFYEPMIFGDMQTCGPTYGTDFDYGTAGSQITIVTPSHPIAAGFMGPISVLTSSQTYTWGIARSGGVVVASVPGTPSHATIIAYDKGAAMYGMTAPSRRVTWFCNGYVGTDKMTAAGWSMFDAAIRWASDTNYITMSVK